MRKTNVAIPFQNSRIDKTFQIGRIPDFSYSVPNPNSHFQNATLDNFQYIFSPRIDILVAQNSIFHFEVLMTQITVCKFQYFSVAQILREISFGQSRCSKTAVFAILGALNLVNFVNFSILK